MHGKHSTVQSQLVLGMPMEYAPMLTVFGCCGPLDASPTHLGNPFDAEYAGSILHGRRPVGQKAERYRTRDEGERYLSEPP